MRSGKFWNNRRNLVFLVIALCVLLCGTLAASFYVSHNITDELRENAYNSLMDASEIIRQTLDSAILDDIDLISTFGAVLHESDYEDISSLLAKLCDVNKLQHAYYVDVTGAGISETGEYFNISSLPVAQTALGGKASVSTGFVGETGQQHMIIQAPILDGENTVGAIFGEVVATRYFFDDTYVFFNGEGRASLFNRANGNFVIKAPQSELAYLKTDNIFDAIKRSGNDMTVYDTFKEKVSAGAKSIIQMQYGDVTSYVAVLPCKSNDQLYIATIISREALQVEADSISRLILLMQGILIVGLSGLIVLGSLLLYRMMKEEQARATRELEERSREELTAALVRAQEANIAKTRFLSNMSHDIRTPMNAIMGMTTLAAQSLGDDETLNDCLSVIASSSRHLLDLINDILDMSKIESGSVEFLSAPFAVPSAVNSITSIIAPLCKARQQTFNVKFINIKHEYLIGDKTKVNQVLMNLLNNANKFTPAGGEIRFVIEELSAADESIATYRFLVIDNGIGIAKEYHDSVFDAFTRVDDPLNDNVEGTGLGLPIARSIVRAMGGAIELESEPGEGSTFTVTLSFPVQLKQNFANDYPELEGGQMLVVSDADVCSRAREYLSDVGVTAYTATSAQEAESMPERRYTMALIDWALPDCIECIRMTRLCMGAGYQIIVLTDNAIADIEVDARMAGANAFLSKPLFRSSLYEEMALLLNSKALQKKPAATLSNMRILLVEDHLVNQEVARRLLESAGAKVDVANDGQEGVDAFISSGEGYYNAILMDIQMPVLDGYEATKQIRASSHPNAASVPIIALTANAFAEDNVRTTDAGMNAYLTKPIEPRVMFDTLNKLITK